MGLFERWWIVVVQRVYEDSESGAHTRGPLDLPWNLARVCQKQSHALTNPFGYVAAVPYSTPRPRLFNGDGRGAL